MDSTITNVLGASYQGPDADLSSTYNATLFQSLLSQAQGVSEGDAVDFKADAGLELKDPSRIPRIAVIDDFTSVREEIIMQDHETEGEVYLLPTSHGELVVNAIESTLGSQHSGLYKVDKIDIHETPNDIASQIEQLPQSTERPDYLNISWFNDASYEKLSLHASTAAGHDVVVTKENVKDMSSLILKGMEMNVAKHHSYAQDWRELQAISKLADTGTKIYIAAGNNGGFFNEDTYANLYSLAASPELNKSGNINIVTGTQDYQNEPSSGAEAFEFENQLVTDRAPSFIRFERNDPDEDSFSAYGGRGMFTSDSQALDGKDSFTVLGGSSSAAPFELGQDVAEDFFKPESHQMLY